MVRYPNLFLSLLMLGLSFSARREHWIVDIRVFDHAIQGDLKNLIFVICTFAYVPVFFFSISLFAIDTTNFIKYRNPKTIMPILIFSLMPLFALYRFGDWVMSAIL